MKGHFTEHPLYQKDENGLCAVATEALMAAGHTVFQIYQMPLSEIHHAEWLLRMTDPECKAKRVLSLGCGIGGMEAYWKIMRPDMTFELVNISQEQIKRCVCRGRKVCADAETYRSDQPPFDLVAICYLLGHVNVHSTLSSALANLAPWGRLLVYDLFEGTQNLRETLLYDTPSFEEVETFGVTHKMRFRATIQDRGRIPLADFFRDNFGWIGFESRPGLFVFQRE
jgi:SAM-dependent methyltransferase